MNAVTKRVNVMHSTVAKKASAVKAPTAKKGMARNIDGTVSKTVAAKGVPVKGAKALTKRAPAGKVLPPETPPTSEALSIPIKVMLSSPSGCRQEICADLMKRDRVLRRIIPTCGPAHLILRGDPFITLARSIVDQQISVEATQSMWERVMAVCPKLVPAQFPRTDQEKPADCGLSKRKVECTLDLVDHLRNGTVHVVRWAEMGDQDVIAELTQIHGIGRWTAEMFLMFNLMCPSVLPLDDVRLISAISRNYFNNKPVTCSEAHEVAVNWES